MILLDGNYSMSKIALCASQVLIEFEKFIRLARA